MSEPLTDPDRRRSVLVVEDHPDLARAMVALLTVKGHAPAVALNAAEAEAMLWCSAAPDVVLLDLMLPDRDGTHVLRAIRQRGLPCRVIVVTACNGGDPLVAEARRIGVRAVIHKPIDFEALYAAIEAP